MKGRLKFLIEEYAKAWSRYDRCYRVVSSYVLEKQKKVLTDLENDITNELKNYKYIEKNENYEKDVVDNGVVCVNE